MNETSYEFLKHDKTLVFTVQSKFRQHLINMRLKAIDHQKWNFKEANIIHIYHYTVAASKPPSLGFSRQFWAITSKVLTCNWRYKIKRQFETMEKKKQA